jgi:hypothetical protein
MLTFEQGEQLLKEMNTTPAELDMMWDACVKAGHSLISNPNRCGKSWRDMNPSAIKTLPREYQKIINPEGGGQG